MGKRQMSRYVGFYWERCGDEVMFDDGAVSATGHWHQFVLFAQHCRIRPHLRGFDFGSSETEPVHYLILDREERKLFVASVDVARAFLLAQHPELVNACSEPMVVQDLEELMRTIATGWREIEVSQQQIAEAMRRDQELYTVMSEWLSQAVPGHTVEG
jgi:hypothetical protein